LNKEICILCNTELELHLFSEDGKTCKECVRLMYRKESPEKYLMSLGVGKRHSVCTFENYNGNEHKRLMELLINDFGENVLIQSANVGNGKTHLAVASLLKYGLINNGIHRFVNYTNLMLEIKSTFSNETTENESDIINKYCGYNMLVIDDVGAERGTDYTISILYIILNNRYEASKPTIITTNMVGDEILNQYGKRILSRLRSGYLITLNSKDHRGLK